MAFNFREDWMGSHVTILLVSIPRALTKLFTSSPSFSTYVSPLHCMDNRKLLFPANLEDVQSKVNALPHCMFLIGLLVCSLPFSSCLTLVLPAISNGCLISVSGSFSFFFDQALQLSVSPLSPHLFRLF